MKKFVAMMLLVCMLMTAAAFAERTVLQDEQAPMLVAAELYDAEGKRVAEIEENDVVLTDVYFREPVERLVGAYEGVMGGVHYSDVSCLVHDDHAVQAEINEILAAIEEDFDAFDLVMYELYDVVLAEEVAAQMVDGGYAKLTFELISEESLPLITLFTPDGVKWEVIDATAEDGNCFSVELNEGGVIALLCDGREAMGIGKDAEPEVEEDEFIFNEDDEPGYHTGFTPSVTGKPAPELVEAEDESGEPYIGYISVMVSAEDGEATFEKVYIPNRNYVLVTPVSECDYVADIQTHEHLEWAYDIILNAENAGALPTVGGVLADAMNAELAANGFELTCDQMVVKDLFEVTMYGDYVEYMYDENNYLCVTFNVGRDADEPFIVMYSADSVNWNVLTGDNVKVNDNGSVTLKLYDLGAVAFLVEGDAEIDAEAAVQSPN